MSESTITPMLCNYKGDAVTCYLHKADFFRVVICGFYLGDFDSLQGAERAFHAAHRDEFPKGTLSGNVALISESSAGVDEQVTLGSKGRQPVK